MILVCNVTPLTRHWAFVQLSGSRILRDKKEWVIRVTCPMASLKRFN